MVVQLQSLIFKKTNKRVGKRKKLTVVRVITDVGRMEQFISHWAWVRRGDKIRSAVLGDDENP